MHALESAFEALKRDFDAACIETAITARRQVTVDLNQIFRRLRHYENEDQWIGAVRDATSKFASGFGIFTQKNGSFVLRAQQSLGLAESLAFSVTSAKAFSSVVESGDPVVALRSTGEVGEVLTTAEPSRAHLFPISNAGRVVALIFAADQPSLDVDALELLAGMASSVLERRANQSIHSQIEPAPVVNKPANGAVKKRPALPLWADLSEGQRGLHVKAQRFSRVAVAQMQLARPEACREGRKQNNLYMFLQSEIDKAREAYRKQFMTISSMVDYLHLELLNTAAEGDERKLGADYPGQLS